MAQGVNAGGDPSKTKRPATIYDVARRAQVSHQTVSRFLKGYTRIKPDSRLRVEQALRELDYRPNASARALATNRSRRIGAIVYGLTESGPRAFIEGASDAARREGYVLDIVSVHSVEDGAVAAALEILNQPDLAGVVALTPTDPVFDAVNAARFQVPIWIEAESEDEPDGPVRTLNAIGAERSVEHLVGLGHRSITHLAGPLAWVSARNRARAYTVAMARHGLRPTVLTDGDWSARSGYEQVAQMDVSTTTALIVANDQMALGALRALYERGFAVPADLSVVGFDDIPEAQYTIPPLTTVRIDFEQQGRTAIASLIAQIEGSTASPAPSTGDARLILRASSGPARQT
jgi:DNA-binding LacI/PurR family transcriptional regulator